MPATISKEFAFSASHVLDGLHPLHPCGRLHGHNYVIRVELTGEVKPVGFVIDYRELGFVKRYIDDVLDHNHLNDVIPGINPTAENLSRFLHDIIRPQLGDDIAIAVAVSETPKTWATWTP